MLRREVTITGGKRKRGASYTGGVGRKRYFPMPKVPRRMSMASPSNGVIIPIVTSYDSTLTADPNFAFQFSPQHLIVDGTAISITGAADLNNVFEFVRVHKVEITILPAATGLDYSAQSLSTGTTNIPYCYHAVDYTDPVGGKGLNQIRQNPTCQIHLLNKPIKRTIYPKLINSDVVIDLSRNNKDKFVRSNATISLQDQSYFNGYVFTADMKDVVWTYGQLRFNFKIFYECRQSK